ncbi:MAG TPA: sulfur carrier protein ThiS [Micromonosporaceae bacterium]|nr:sulfur carrier protein ThiS [Micromonosporaceae bacterium]
MRVTVNGAARDLVEGSTVATAVRAIGDPGPAVAVARNGEVVPRGEWERTVLVDGDRLEILAPTAGG